MAWGTSIETANHFRAINVKYYVCSPCLPALVHSGARESRWRCSEQHQLCGRSLSELVRLPAACISEHMEHIIWPCLKFEARPACNEVATALGSVVAT